VGERKVLLLCSVCVSGGVFVCVAGRGYTVGT